MKKIIIGFLVFVVGLMAVFAAINFKDEPLDVAVADILNKNFKYTPEQIAGYKYLLGITAPIGESVEDVGEKRYQEIITYLNDKEVSIHSKNGGKHKIDLPQLPCEWTCTKEQILAQPNEIALYLSSVKAYIDRIDTLLSFNGIVNTIQPAISNDPPTFAVFNMMRFKILDLRYKAYVEKSKAVVPELEKMQNHFVNDLSHPSSLIDTAIDTAILSEVRDFYNELIDEPIYKTAKVPNPKLDIESIVNGTIYYELKAFDDALDWDVKYVLFSSTFDRDARRGTPWYQRFFVQKNRTLNMHYRGLLKAITTRCQSKDECGSTVITDPTWQDYVHNPVGNMYARLFGQNDKSYAKMILKLENINQGK